MKGMNMQQWPVLQDFIHRFWTNGARTQSDMYKFGQMLNTSTFPEGRICQFYFSNFIPFRTLGSGPSSHQTEHLAFLAGFTTFSLTVPSESGTEAKTNWPEPTKMHKYFFICWPHLMVLLIFIQKKCLFSFFFVLLFCSVAILVYSSPVKRRKGWPVTYLILLPHILAFMNVIDTDYWAHVVASTHSHVFLTSKHHFPQAGTKTEQKTCCMSAFSHHSHWYSLSCFPFLLKNWA